MIFAFFAGIMFIAFPEASKKYVSIGIGVFLIGLGIYSLIYYFVKHSSTGILVSGIVLMIIGIIVAVKYEEVAKLFIVLLGVFIVSAGITNLVAGLKIVYEKLILGWTTLLLSVATIVFGVIAIVNSGDLQNAVTRLIGIGLIIYAIVDLVVYIQVRSAVKEASEQVQLISDVETEATVIGTEDDIEGGFVDVEADESEVNVAEADSIEIEDAE